jgi:hypothetical protein
MNWLRRLLGCCCLLVLLPAPAAAASASQSWECDVSDLIEQIPAPLVQARQAFGAGDIARAEASARKVIEPADGPRTSWPAIVVLVGLGLLVAVAIAVALVRRARRTRPPARANDQELLTILLAQPPGEAAQPQPKKKAA